MKTSRERQALMQYLLHLEGEPVFDDETLAMGKNLLELRWKEIEDGLGEIKRWVDRALLRELWLNFFEPVVINLETVELPRSFLLFLLNNSLARDFLSERCEEEIFAVIETRLKQIP